MINNLTPVRPAAKTARTFFDPVNNNDSENRSVNAKNWQILNMQKYKEQHLRQNERSHTSTGRYGKVELPTFICHCENDP